jgi:hypothetical protein
MAKYLAFWQSYKNNDSAQAIIYTDPSCVGQFVHAVSHCILYLEKRRTLIIINNK